MLPLEQSSTHILFLPIFLWSLLFSHRRQHESEQGRELLDREHLIDNEADRNRHARLMNRLNKLDLAIFKVDSTILLMEHF